MAAACCCGVEPITIHETGYFYRAHAVRVRTICPPERDEAPHGPHSPRRMEESRRHRRRVARTRDAYTAGTRVVRRIHRLSRRALDAAQSGLFAVRRKGFHDR